MCKIDHIGHYDICSSMFYNFDDWGGVEKTWKTIEISDNLLLSWIYLRKKMVEILLRTNRN